MFTLNESTTDRTIRAIVGLILIYIGFSVLSGALGSLAWIIGFILLVTGVVGWCPLYRLFGINTKHSGSKPGSGAAMP